MSELVKNSHCSYCGSLFAEQNVWPRKCFVCYNDSFSNPTPVVVVLLKVQRAVSQGSTTIIQNGLLIQKRGIEPQKGGWALTGGYIDDRETWQHAAVREVREELGLETKEKNYKLWDATSSTNKENILIFCT
jgi:NADH pyrophosphatase NudC (nudix superfamily)